MKRSIALLAAVAVFGLPACDTGPDEDELLDEEVDVTPTPAPVVTDTMMADTMAMDTMMDDTMMPDTMAGDTM